MIKALNIQMIMRKLASSFIGTGEMKGFSFTQIKNNEYAYLYEVRSLNDDNIILDTWYEAFERRISKDCDRVFNGEIIHYESAEIYPKSSVFGIWAFSINNYNKALLKFNELTEKALNRMKNSK